MQLKAEKGNEDITQDSGWGGQSCLEVGLSEQGCRRGGANLVVERRQLSSVRVYKYSSSASTSSRTMSSLQGCNWSPSNASCLPSQLCLASSFSQPKLQDFPCPTQLTPSLTHSRASNLHYLFCKSLLSYFPVKILPTLDADLLNSTQKALIIKENT